MQKKRNSFPKKERLEDEMNNRFGSEEEFLARYEDWELDDIPDDPKDQRRRLEVMMEELRAKGHLSAEEEEKLFGPGGYLNNPATSKETPLTARPSDPPPGKGKRRSPGKMLYHMKKTAAVMAVVLGGITVVAFSSEANRQYVADMVTYAIGGDTRVKVTDGSDNLIKNKTENQTKELIKEDVGINMPILDYKPNGLKFVKGESIKSSLEAYMFYEKNGETIVLYAIVDEGGKLESRILDGNSSDKVPVFFDKAEANIVGVREGEKEIYSAFWEYEGVYYQLSGKLKKGELKKILLKLAL